MNRFQLEHIIRAAASVADTQDIVVIGSQSLLGQVPEAPAELTASMEADVFPKHEPEKAIVIDGAIGEMSIFHQTFGYYAHGVGADTAVLPPGWQDRLVCVRNENTHGAAGWCLEVHDLAVSKLAAGREKDIQFVRDMIRFGIANSKIVRERLDLIQAITPQRRRELVLLIERGNEQDKT